MTIAPGIRKFALSAHVTASVGWLGAVVVFLALAIIGLTSQDAQTVRGAYLVMEPAARLVLVPLAFGQRDHGSRGTSDTVLDTRRRPGRRLFLRFHRSGCSGMHSAACQRR